ncbi:MAG: SUMF1/EgtB/PvdO family nonheme iron enzyme [Opitutales bacterium]|nr:SUMF1/EgtB/PvdO family nonheme iron enzyme [Opitutales bacterium]
MPVRVLRAAALLVIPVPVATAASPEPETGGGLVNTLGMEMLRIEPGTFERGSPRGDDEASYSERPVHTVHITRPFHVASTPVTNAQYERFDPDHREQRGKWGISEEDDEAVVFVSWDEAVAFTEWLSAKEGEPYRLPTEAEWEYAARAGTTTPFFTGEELPDAFHRYQRNAPRPEPVDLRVGQTPPNPWGLHDVHGIVEEWTLDWYGPYLAGEQTDPVGYDDGDAKVTRGGSHNSPLPWLRSAARLANLPENKNWLIGFRVVRGARPDTTPLSRDIHETPQWARDVVQERHEWPVSAEQVPHFAGPRIYVHLPGEAPWDGFLAHCPALTLLPNGDLFAAWHVMGSERGRGLLIAAARFRAGGEAWDTAAKFLTVPGRNLHGPALYTDGDGTVYHFNGYSAGGQIHHILAMIMRTSTDNGRTWSKPKLIGPEHGSRHQVIDRVFETGDGAMVLAADSNPGGTALHLSRDGGKTWSDPGGTIPGIHAGVVELADGRLLAIGRGRNIEERSPLSVSADMGESWESRASPFPPVGSGQRPYLLRLDEGPILYVAFTDDRNEPRERGMMFRNQKGEEFRGHGMFAALSYDEGETWPVRKLITPADGEEYFARHVRGPSAPFTASYDNAEHQGYVTAVQAPDGIIHLISSRHHYEFNLAWLEEPASLPR